MSIYKLQMYCSKTYSSIIQTNMVYMFMETKFISESLSFSRNKVFMKLSYIF